VLAKASGTDFDTEWVDQTGGGSGTVESVVAGTGISVDSTDPANPVVANTGATAAQGAKADTAIQPDDLATVATTGAYSDLTGTPTIPDSADDIGAVPTTRTVNSKALSADITLSASDVGAAASSHTHAESDVTGLTTDLAAKLAKASNLSDLANAGTARTNLGLGTAATKDTGTGTGNVILGNDSRLSDARTPTAHASSHASGGTDALALDASQVTRTTNAQTGTTYTLVLTDATKFVSLSNASAITLTVPPNSSVAFPVGTEIILAQLGAGQVTIAPGSGVTLNSTPGLKIAAQYGTAALKKTASDTWLVFGRLAS
jgi:hypothetical protein